MTVVEDALVAARAPVAVSAVTQSSRKVRQSSRSRSKASRYQRRPDVTRARGEAMRDPQETLDRELSGRTDSVVSRPLIG